MVRRLISTLIVTIWVSGIFYLRNNSLPHIIFIIAAACFWLGLITVRERFHFGLLKKIDYKCTRFLDAMGDKTLFLNVWLLAFLCFIPAFIAFFPGIFGYDAPSQFAMFMGRLPFDSAQQPLLHTLFIGGIISLGKLIFGSYQAGFVCLVLVQGLLISNCMAFVFIFLRKRNVPLLFILLGMLWVVWNPYIQILNCNVTKDVMFAVFFIDFIMAVIHGLEKEKMRISDIAALFISGLLMCLFRNGLVLAVAVLFVFSLILRVKKKELYIIFAAVILVSEIFSFSAQQFFGIKKSPEKEFFAVPIQQLSYVMYLNEVSPESVNISEVERETFLELIPNAGELVEQFNMYNADPPKTMFSLETFKKDRLRYFTLYMHVGEKNTGAYLKSWRYLVWPYFYMNLNEHKALMLRNFFMLFFENSEVDIHSDAKYLEKYRNYLEDAASGNTKLFNEPIWAILLLGLMIGWSVARDSKSIFLGSMVILTYFFGILLGPIALMRYTYPLMLAFPLMFGLLFCGGKYVPDSIKQEKLLEEVKKS